MNLWKKAHSMDKRLKRWEGKVALVTGATSGIGWAIAMELAKIGMKVAATGRRSERLEELKAHAGELGAEVLPITADQSTVEGNHEIFRQLRKQWGGVDVLVNNAGLGLQGGIAEVDIAKLQSMLDLNVRAAAICLQEAVKDMQDREEGTIINMSSISGHRIVLNKGAAFYSATKHALRVMVDGLRNELANEGSMIKVCMISPGMVDTPFHEVFDPKGKPAQTAYQPLEAWHIADAALYILSTPPQMQVSDMIIRSLHQAT